MFNQNSETGLLHFLNTFFQGLFNIYQIDGPVHLFLPSSKYLFAQQMNLQNKLKAQSTELLNKAKKNTNCLCEKMYVPSSREIQKTNSQKIYLPCGRIQEKKYVPSMPMHRSNNLINIERSLMCSGFRFICCVVISVTVGCRFG